MLVKTKRAQSTAEYAILLALVVAAAMGIQNEVRRAIQARVHDAAVSLVTSTGGQTLQYEPTTGTKTTTGQKSIRDKKENFLTGGSDETWITTNDESEASYDSTTTQ